MYLGYLPTYQKKKKKKEEDSLTDYIPPSQAGRQMISGNLSSEIENNDMVYETCLAAISLENECLEVGRMRAFSFFQCRSCVYVSRSDPPMHSKAEQSKAKLTWQHVARSDACDVGSG